MRFRKGIKSLKDNGKRSTFYTAVNARFAVDVKHGFYCAQKINTTVKYSKIATKIPKIGKHSTFYTAVNARFEVDVKHGFYCAQKINTTVNHSKVQ